MCQSVLKGSERRVLVSDVLCEIEFNLSGNFFSLGSHFVSSCLLPCISAFCHFNYSTADYFYTSNAISRNTGERAVKILGGGS